MPEKLQNILVLRDDQSTKDIIINAPAVSMLATVIDKLQKQRTTDVRANKG
jgi:hypothetical protein